MEPKFHNAVISSTLHMFPFTHLSLYPIPCTSSFLAPHPLHLIFPCTSLAPLLPIAPLPLAQSLSNCRHSLLDSSQGTDAKQVRQERGAHRKSAVANLILAKKESRLPGITEWSNGKSGVPNKISKHTTPVMKFSTKTKKVKSMTQLIYISISTALFSPIPNSLKKI